MFDEQRVEIEKLEGHHCFACGTENPIGLDLRFYRVGDAVCSDITLGKNHEGWENVAHGGIVSTLVDEVMSWAIFYFKKRLLVTRKMTVKYVRPVLIGVPLTVKGTMLDDSRPPRITAKGEVRDDEGRLLVRSSAEFVMLEKEDLTMIPDSLKDEMFALFRKFGPPR
ncbi:MAG: PaaI family thioesterase [Deltaproteobacteria bacterium]|nr:MAG: PaaI family thioesterase [Deltaproteobacteria bacterium]